MGNYLYDVRELRVSFGNVNVVDGVSFQIEEGEIFAMLGETGAGKTMIFKAVTGLLPSEASVEGSIFFSGEELTAFSENKWRQHRLEHIGIALQNSASALNPMINLKQHFNLCAKSKFSTAAMYSVLDMVGLETSEQFLKKHPFQLSGGMKQRFLIAMAMIKKPKILFLDEPTRGQDSILRFEIAKLVKTLREEIGTTVFVITHDIGFARAVSDRVAVLSGGRFQEMGQAKAVFLAPRSDYFQELIAAMPENGLHVRGSRC